MTASSAAPPPHRPLTPATPAEPLGWSAAGPAGAQPEPLPEDQPGWMSQPAPAAQPGAGDYIPLDQRAPLATLARQEGLRGDGQDAPAPKAPGLLELDPAAQRARLRRGALPLSPSAMRAHVRSATARAQALAAEDAAQAPGPVEAAQAPGPVEAAQAPGPVEAAQAAAPESPKVRAAPPMTIPREKKRGPVA